MTSFFFIMCAGAVALAVILQSFSNALDRSRHGSKTPGGHSFHALPLLNKSERRIHAELREVVPQIFGRRAHLLTQVSYGEFLRGDTFAATATINQKRADFVIADEDFNVCCVVEYQGNGHWGSTSGAARNAEKRDGRKRDALKSAGIPFVELRSSATPAEIVKDLRRVFPNGPRQSREPLSPRSDLAPLEPMNSPNNIRVD